MKSICRRTISTAVILMMIFTAVIGNGAVSYAAEPPVIIFSEPDHKLAPGEEITADLTLDQGADSVVLEAWNEEEALWETFGNCLDMDPGKTIWTYIIPAYPDNGEGVMRFRFAVYYGGDYSVIHSEPFTIEWAEPEALIPEILYCSCDHWLWPGEPFTVGVVTTAGSTGAVLEYFDEETHEWQKYADCLLSEADKSWYFDIPPYPDDGEGTITFRFAISYGNGSEPPVISDVFTMYWTRDYGYERIYGANRYETALLVAGEKLALRKAEKYDNVVIACGTEFADALGSTYLAAIKNAPILLVNTNPEVIGKVAENVRDYLSDTGSVYILGGIGAVSEAMEAALAEAGITEDRIVRFAGANRYDTNLQILEYCEPAGQDLLICCGTNFADALSASAVGKPILLVGNALREEQAEFISSARLEKKYIIGGTGAVSEGIEGSIEELGFNALRVAGDNRYDTSALVASEFFSERQRHYVTLAYGLNFPDGLAGGPLCLDLYPEAPLLLVKEGSGDYAAAYIKYNGRTRRAKVLGGPSLISDELVEKIIYSRAEG